MADRDFHEKLIADADELAGAIIDHIADRELTIGYGLRVLEVAAARTMAVGHGEASLGQVIDDAELQDIIGCLEATFLKSLRLNFGKIIGADTRRRLAALDRRLKRLYKPDGAGEA